MVLRTFPLFFFFLEVIIMEILDCLRDQQQWQLFYEYKMSCNNLPDWMLKQLQLYIAEQRYLAVADRIDAGLGFSHPKKSAISKMHSEKKRIVYTYPQDENWALKFITYLLLRRYDHLFSPNLYSFRANTGVAFAIRDLSRIRGIDKMYSYKVDIRNYFNSIPIDRLLPMVESVLGGEPRLYRFIEGLLTDPFVMDGGKEIAEEKGIMAGTPVSTFLANLYLRDMDAMFFREGIPYARYSDDIILFAPTEAALERNVQRIHETLEKAGLNINPAKESRTAPGEKWVFLGISYQKGIVDVAPVSVEKIKAKMRRKTRALRRWADRKNLPGERAAKAFIRVFNRKLFHAESEHELTWARWFFPLINTADSLHAIDLYAQNCIRYLATGKHTKAAYNFRYEDMKALGYVSLVNAYYRHRDGQNI